MSIQKIINIVTAEFSGKEKYLKYFNSTVLSLIRMSAVWSVFFLCLVLTLGKTKINLAIIRSIHYCGSPHKPKVGFLTKINDISSKTFYPNVCIIQLCSQFRILLHKSIVSNCDHWVTEKHFFIFRTILL